MQTSLNFDELFVVSCLFFILKLASVCVPVYLSGVGESDWVGDDGLSDSGIDSDWCDCFELTEQLSEGSGDNAKRKRNLYM